MSKLSGISLFSNLVLAPECFPRMASKSSSEIRPVSNRFVSPLCRAMVIGEREVSDFPLGDVVGGRRSRICSIRGSSLCFRGLIYGHGVMRLLSSSNTLVSSASSLIFSESTLLPLLPAVDLEKNFVNILLAALGFFLNALSDAGVSVSGGLYVACTTFETSTIAAAETILNC